MLSSFKNAYSWMSLRPQHVIGVRISQFMIGIMLCMRISTELPFALYLWGEQGLGASHSTKTFFGSELGTYFDDLFFSSEIGIYSLLFLLFLSALGLIFNFQTRIMSLLAFILFVGLENRLPAINDGGDNITRLVLFYMVFLISKPNRKIYSEWKVWLHNIGVISIILQLVILYATSGLMKAFGEKWHNGTAMYVISNVEWFSVPAYRDMFLHPVISTLGTYIPLLFMILFPVAIISRLKLLWIFIGISLHLGIAIMMGLITFSTVMIGLELLIISDNEYNYLLRSFYESKVYTITKNFLEKKELFKLR